MPRRGSLLKAVAPIALLSLCLTLLIPSVAGTFSVFRDTNKLVGFVVRVPENLTRPLGPLAPIAQIWLLREPPKFGQIVKKAGEIKAVSNDIDEQNKKVQEVRAIYRSQAQTFRNRAGTLEEKRKTLAKELEKSKLAWNDYRGKVVAIQQMINSLNKAAEELDDKANKLGAQEIIAMFSKEAADTLFDNSKGLVVQEIAAEIDGVVNPLIVSTFLDDGLKAHEVIDHFIDGDIEHLIIARKLDKRPDIKELRRRIRDKVKSSIKDDIDFLENSWGEELEAVIEKLVAEADRALERPDESAGESTTKTREEPADAPKYDPKNGRVYEGAAAFDDVLRSDNDNTQHCPQQIKIVIQLGKDGRVNGRFYVFKSYPIIPDNGCVETPAKLWPVVGTHENGSFEAQTNYLVKISGSYDARTLRGKGTGLLTSDSPNGRHFTIGPFTLTNR